MGVTDVGSVYSFAERFKLTSSGITAIDLKGVEDGLIIEGALVRVHTPAVRAAGAVNLILGDDDDDDGFIASADAKAAADTIYGDTVTERGVYLYDATSKAGHYKVYQTTSKEFKFKLDVAPDTQGVYEVIIFGHRAGFSS